VGWVCVCVAELGRDDTYTPSASLLVTVADLLWCGFDLPVYETGDKPPPQRLFCCIDHRVLPAGLLQASLNCAGFHMMSLSGIRALMGPAATQVSKHVCVCVLYLQVSRPYVLFQHQP